MQHIIFFAHGHAPVVTAVLTKNERCCSQLQNSVSLAC